VTWLILLTGFVLGLRHALDPDHVAAVTHFISVEPNSRRGAWFGVMWGLGHGLTVLVLGTVMIAFGLRLSPEFERGAEVVVGATLILLAAWRLKLLADERRHAHPHQHQAAVHAHRHNHLLTAGHVHPYAPTLMGMVHGAAGTLAVFVLIPISFMASGWLAYAYMAVFSVGCVLSMTGYGVFAGRWYGAIAAGRDTSLQDVGASHAPGRARRAPFQWLVVGTSLAGLVLGVFWIARPW